MKKEWPGHGPLSSNTIPGRTRAIGFEEYIQQHGSGHNYLRTSRVVQPGALCIGDVLANGDKVLSLPREGGNGSVLIHLTGGFDGHWIDVPARIPIALLTSEDNAPEEIRELGTPIHIVSIFIATEKGVPMEEVSEIEATPSLGLQGDRYGTERGSWSMPGKAHRQVTFIEYEAIEAASREMAVPLTPAETRRNIVTHGVKLNDLVGKEFTIRAFQEEIRFRGTKLCDPCDRPPKLAGKTIPLGIPRATFKAAYDNRGGLCAEVIEGGTIHVGNEIVVE